jgi:hypothetical protein
MESIRVISTELFPYETFPIRLEFGEKKNTTVSYFQCQEHLDKYLERYKLDKRTIKLDYRDGEPSKPSQKRKRSVEQKPEPKSKGSVGTGKKRTTRLDSTRNTTSTTKRKK